MSKKVKEIVDNILDKTDLDEKVVAKYNENPGLYNKILCYIKCYGGYLLAVLAGCTFNVSFVWGIILLVGAAGWAYLTTCNCKLCKNGTGGCCNG